MSADPPVALAAQRLAAGLETAMLQPLLEPLERVCGAMGGLLTEAWSREIADGGGDAFTALLRRALERTGG